MNRSYSTQRDAAQGSTLNHLEGFGARAALSFFVAILVNAGCAWSQTGNRGSLAEAEDAARAGNFDGAAQAYRALLKAEPRSAQLWNNLGAVEVMGGHCESALPALDRARSLDRNLFAPWYFAGVCELQFHEDERALADLDRATGINPRDPNAWYLRAQAAANLDRMESAFQSVLKGLALDPARPDGYYQAGKLALDLAARCYDRVTAAPPNSPYPHALQGERNTAQGLAQSGIDNYRKALTLAPDDPSIHFALANAYVEGGKLPEAEGELRQCLALLSSARPQAASRGPGPPATAHTEWVRLRLALVLAREERKKEARQILESVEPARLESPEQFEDFLVSADLLGMSAVAGKVLSRAIARFPAEGEFSARQAGLARPVTESSEGKASDRPDPSVKVGLGIRFLAATDLGVGNLLPRIFPSLGEYRKFRTAFLGNDALASAGMISPRLEPLPQDAARAWALGSLLQWLSYRFDERLATDYPQSEAAQRLAAENLSSAGEQQKALEIYQAILDRSGPSPDLLRAVAQIRWTEHQWDQALEVLESLKKLDPRDPTTLVNLGRIYSYKQDLSSAETSFRQAAEADPRMFEAHLGLGETLRRRGDDEGALREFQIAAGIQPGNPQPHYALSQVYRRRDRKELAQQEMATYERLQAQARLEKTRANRSLVPLD
jgi:tetratricopeptide (TPR) repeat protein